MRRALAWAALVVSACGELPLDVIGARPSPSCPADGARTDAYAGATLPGGDAWVQRQIEALWASPSGRVFATSRDDPSSHEVTFYEDATSKGALESTHAWGRSGGRAIAGNGRHVFIAMLQGPSGKAGEDYPPEGTTWSCIRRYTHDGTTAPWATGRGFDRSMLIVGATTGAAAIAATDRELYVADPSGEVVRVFDAATMQPLRMLPIRNAVALAVPAAGDALWVATSSSVTRWTVTGEPTDGVLDVRASALAFDAAGRLLLADAEHDELVFADVATDPRSPRVLDSVGGSGSSLRFGRITGIGADASGAVYVSADDGTTTLRRLRPDRSVAWELRSAGPQPAGAFDPAGAGDELVSPAARYVRRCGTDGASAWPLVGLSSAPGAPAASLDLRVRDRASGVIVRRLAGRRVMFVVSSDVDLVVAYRFDGDVATPTAAIGRHAPTPWLDVSPPGAGAWTWNDENANGRVEAAELASVGEEPWPGWGWSVDDHGDVWAASEGAVPMIHRVPLVAMTAQGAPRYDLAAHRDWPLPTPMTSVDRLRYDDAADALFVSGQTATDTTPLAGTAGAVLARYDGWSRTPTLAWMVKLPLDLAATPDRRFIKALAFAPDRIYGLTQETDELFVWDRADGRPSGPYAIPAIAGHVVVTYGLDVAALPSRGHRAAVADEAWSLTRVLTLP